MIFVEKGYVSNQLSLGMHHQENACTAWSLVAMVAFISMLCDRAFSATHYALLASLGNLGRTLLSSYSGVVIDDWLLGNWALFFVLTALMVIPSLVFLFLIRHKLYALENNYHRDN